MDATGSVTPGMGQAEVVQESEQKLKQQGLAIKASQCPAWGGNGRSKMKTMKKMITLLAVVGLVLAVAGSALAGTVVDGWTVIDNEDSADALGSHTKNGENGNTNGGPPNWASNMDYYATSQGDSATWTFIALTPGTYEVAVSWEGGSSNRATDSPFSINGGTAIDINQELTPTGTPTLNDGSKDVLFQTIDAAVTVAGTTLTVVLTDDANQFVIADAVAIKLVPPSAPP